MEPIYFDHAATTPPRPEVVEAMLTYYREHWGNPSSLHWSGRAAREAMDRGREQVAALLGALPEEIVFTGSGTEADNQALIGISIAHEKKGDHIVTSTIEHHAILHTAQFLEKRGIKVTYLPVDSSGMVDPDAVRKAITDKTILVSIMHANNEIGSLQPVRDIGTICREREVLFHTDAVQTVGHLPINVREMNADLLSLSAHKLYGPKGVGALFVRKGVRVSPLIHGGGHERGRRSSTENVPGIVGLGEAARLAAEDMEWELQHNSGLRDRLIEGLLDRVPDSMLTGHPTQRLPNNASFCIRYIEGESMLLNLDFEGIAVSSGSACTSGSLEASHVLLAIGLAHDVAHGSLRISVGRGNTVEEVDRFLEVFPPIVEKLRSMSPISAAQSADDWPGTEHAHGSEQHEH
ncbi:MAG: cysteine desulfurase NifS [Armatimonadota bacterium]|nr:MAG: cysteine desulfurase NifS [Armatimonadota bacterium]